MAEKELIVKFNQNYLINEIVEKEIDEGDCESIKDGMCFILSTYWICMSLKTGKYYDIDKIYKKIKNSNQFYIKLINKMAALDKIDDDKITAKKLSRKLWHHKILECLECTEFGEMNINNNDVIEFCKEKKYKYGLLCGTYYELTEDDGHAIGLFWDEKTYYMFDPNYGIYKINGIENGEELQCQIKQQLSNNYIDSKNKPDKFDMYIIAKRTDSIIEQKDISVLDEFESDIDEITSTLEKIDFECNWKAMFQKTYEELKNEI